jgi:SAM-dependent methyltransferase
MTIETPDIAYCANPATEREGQPLYWSTRELIKRLLSNSEKAKILDLGCSDLVATGRLIENGFNVTGVDIDLKSLVLGRDRNHEARLVCGDIRKLPLETSKYDVVVMLDVLEHLERNEAIQLLQEFCHKGNPDQILLVALPIVNPVSWPTIRERIQMLKTGQPPRTGLFDVTHKLFLDRPGHRKLFNLGGFEVVTEYVTNDLTGISGCWQNFEAPTHPDNRWWKKWLRQMVISLPHCLFMLTTKQQEEVFNTLMGFNGLYVLRKMNQSLSVENAN